MIVTVVGVIILTIAMGVSIWRICLAIDSDIEAQRRDGDNGPDGAAQ